MNMKTRVYIMAVCGLSLSASMQVHAEDSVKASAGCSLVSGYLWRGQDLGGISIQPTVSVVWKGWSLTAWGSTSFQQTTDLGNAFADAKEVDLTLGYTYQGFSISVTDYWFSHAYNNFSGLPVTGNYFHYKQGATNHVFEAQIGYDFGKCALSWYTNFAGNDGLTKSGKRAYSSYLSLTFPFSAGGLDWKVELGATPWQTSFYNGGTDGFEMTEISLKAIKRFKITETFELPVSSKIAWNPATERAYLLFGIDL